MKTELPPDDVRTRVDELNHARRRLRQSVDASGIALRRARGLPEGAPLPRIDEPAPGEVTDPWPRAPIAPSRSGSLARLLLLSSIVVLLTAVLVAAALQRPRPGPRPVAEEPEAPATAPSSQAPPVPSPVFPPVSAPEAPAGEAFTVRITAVRQCSARIVVDGTALDWRQLNEGDEIVSGPAYDVLIEASDAGALAATINGKVVSLGEDGDRAAFRVNSNNLQELLP